MKNDLEETRKLLEDLIIYHNYNLEHEEVITLSKQLDELINDYIDNMTS